LSFFPEFEKALLELPKLVEEYSERRRSVIAKYLHAIEWRVVEAQPMESTVCAVDSSFTLIETRIGILFFVQCIAKCRSSDMYATQRSADVGIIDVANLYSEIGLRRIAPKHIVAMVAQLVELEALRNALTQLRSHSDVYALVDGSAISFTMMRPRKTLRVGERIEILSLSRGRTSLLDIAFRRLTLVKELRSISNLVFVAKTSGISTYAPPYPDIELLEYARIARIEPYIRTGFSKPVHLEGDVLSKVLGLPKNVLENYSLNCITISYARLRDYAPTFQLSFAQRVEEDIVENVVRSLAKWSPAGYPVPLESVHRLSKISPKRLRKALHRIGLTPITGREIIEY